MRGKQYLSLPKQLLLPRLLADGYGNTASKGAVEDPGAKAAMTHASLHSPRVSSQRAHQPQGCRAATTEAKN